MKEKKKRRIMPCIEGMVGESFSRDLYFEPGCLGVVGLTLTISHERNAKETSAKLIIVTDDALADSREFMNSLFCCMSIAGKRDGIEWTLNEHECSCDFCIKGSGFDAIHDLLVLAAKASDGMSDHRVLKKMAAVTEAFIVDYGRFTKWREGPWK